MPKTRPKLELSNPEEIKKALLARGDRLRWLRDLTHLNREDLCSEKGLNINTWKGWEIGQHGGLTLKGAKKIVERASKQGVLCTVEWLLEEIGPAPFIIPDFYKTQFKLEPPSSEIFNFTDENKMMMKELVLFKKHYKQTADWIVSDDAMMPEYSIADYIAGLKFPADVKQDLEFALGKNCIVQTLEGHIVFRKLARGTEAGKYNLLCVNPATSVAYPMLYDVALFSVAPVIWHRRKAVISLS